MMLFLASNARPKISFDVHLCVLFTHNTKASHETDVKNIHSYLQGTKENGLVFGPAPISRGTHYQYYLPVHTGDTGP